MRRAVIDFEKYKTVLEQSFIRRMGKVVNVVGLTIESAGPDAKLGDVCRIFRRATTDGRSWRRWWASRIRRPC